jgi:hypothetical protein
VLSTIKLATSFRFFLLEVDGTNPVGMAGNARHYGLYPFRSAKIVAGDGKLLGAPEMYCCVPCSPTSEELSTIEQAECLAAMAIERHNEKRQHDNRRVPRINPCRRLP